MKHRIFVAINLPSAIKEILANYQNKWLELPCRWIKKDNLHITLFFLGYLTDQELLDAIKIVEEIVQKHQPFLIKLTKIIYGPSQKPPRMVWIEGDTSKELTDLQNNLENAFFQKIIKNIKKRPYRFHITLGRIKTWAFRQIEPDERPIIDEEINLDFNVNSIEIMESRLKRGGPEYIVLESFPLSN